MGVVGNVAINPGVGIAIGIASGIGVGFVISIRNLIRILNTTNLK